jgi:hypothetical protein
MTLLQPEQCVHLGQIVRSADAEPIDAVMAAEGRFSDMGIEAIRAVFCL